jgi:hypothetical protein
MAICGRDGQRALMGASESRDACRWARCIVQRLPPELGTKKLRLLLRGALNLAGGGYDANRSFQEAPKRAQLLCG